MSRQRDYQWTPGAFGDRVLDLDVELSDAEQEANDRVRTAQAARLTSSHAAGNRRLAGEPVVHTSEPGGLNDPNGPAAAPRRR